jgi:hypothetical protein
MLSGTLAQISEHFTQNSDQQTRLQNESATRAYHSILNHKENP